MSTETPAYGASSPHITVEGNDLSDRPEIAVGARSGINPELWVRIWFVLFVSSVAFFVQLNEAGREAFAGSQAAYLVVAPILTGLVAAGYSHPLRGVIDSESDWIGAMLLFAGGFGAIWLVEDRLPTAAALWHLDNVALVIWVAACGMVVFSTRHVLRMWKVWLLGLMLAPVMPFLLVTSQLGGSDLAIAMVSACLGSAAVYLATRFVDMRRRLLATVTNMGFSTAALLLLSGASLDLRVLAAAGVVPLVVVLVVHWRSSLTRVGNADSLSWSLPSCKPQSYVALALAAAALLWVHLPSERPAPVDDVRSDWMASAVLDPVENYPFITAFLGPDSSLTRYRAPGGAGEFQTVVDVMTSPDLARLQDFSDAVWYPSTAPVNYTPYDAVPGAPSGIMAARTDADTAKTTGTPEWNAVTWIWRTGNNFQRVTVITSQSRDVAAPDPEPLTITNTLVKPALWVARQQQLPVGELDPIVAASTKVVVQRLLSAGSSPAIADVTP